MFRGARSLVQIIYFVVSPQVPSIVKCHTRNHPTPYQLRLSLSPSSCSPACCGPRPARRRVPPGVRLHICLCLCLLSRSLLPLVLRFGRTILRRVSSFWTSRPLCPTSDRGRTGRPGRGGLRGTEPWPPPVVSPTFSGQRSLGADPNDSLGWGWRVLAPRPYLPLLRPPPHFTPKRTSPLLPHPSAPTPPPACRSIYRDTGCPNRDSSSTGAGGPDPVGRRDGPHLSVSVRPSTPAGPPPTTTPRPAGRAEGRPRHCGRERRRPTFPDPPAETGRRVAAPEKTGADGLPRVHVRRRAWAHRHGPRLPRPTPAPR